METPLDIGAVRTPYETYKKSLKKAQEKIILGSSVSRKGAKDRKARKFFLRALRSLAPLRETF